MWECWLCRNTHEREVHTRTIENARFKISIYWGPFCYFHGKSSQIYLSDWEFQNFVTLLGLMARRFGDPGWDRGYPQIL